MSEIDAPGKKVGNTFGNDKFGRDNRQLLIGRVITLLEETLLEGPFIFDMEVSRTEVGSVTVHYNFNSMTNEQLKKLIGEDNDHGI